MKLFQKSKLPFYLLVLLMPGAGCKKSMPAETLPDNVYYTCSMHPQVMDKKPGVCPICQMDLVRIEVDAEQAAHEVKLSGEQIRLANIQTDTVRLRPLGEEITLSATLKENQNGVNVVTARVAGRIERLFVRNAGEQVRLGQPVFELYSEALVSAQQDYLLALQSQKRYGDGDPNFARMAAAARNKLLLWGMTEQQVADIGQSGQVENTIPFFSKYAGIATGVEAAEGDYVAEGAVVLRLADLQTLWAEAQLYVSDLPFLNQTGEAQVEIPSFPDHKPTGKVSFVNPALETSSKIVMLRVEISNPNRDYQPGMQAWITLRGKSENVVAVPPNALIQGEGGAAVWLKNATGAFESRMVKPGITSRNYIEITDGLQAGEVVVVSGAYLLHSEWVFKRGADPMGEGY